MSQPERRTNSWASVIIESSSVGEKCSAVSPGQCSTSALDCACAVLTRVCTDNLSLSSFTSAVLRAHHQLVCSQLLNCTQHTADCGCYVSVSLLQRYAMTLAYDFLLSAHVVHILLPNRPIIYETAGFVDKNKVSLNRLL
jgi:hypothetical protein